MDVLLTAVNAKYIHSNLAVYSLKSYAKKHMDKGVDTDIHIAEFTINHTSDYIIKQIYQKKPDFLAFSCYIWNIELVMAVMREYKKLDKTCVIWLGGPEVSYNPEEVLAFNHSVDGIMIGEGEETLCKVLTAYQDEAPDFSGIPGIAYRNQKAEGDSVLQNPAKESALCLSAYPFAYEGMEGLSDFENRIIYYESSRGCPFSCSYCLSAIDKTVRFKDMDTIQKEVLFFIRHKVKQVKFVDRTFNCNIRHAMEIWAFLIEFDNGVTNFHFEISADLLTEESVNLINSMRPGLIQLEIGIQSTNPLTLQSINRKTDLEKGRAYLESIRKGKNVHQHLDLIAGLPYEDYQSFRQSFCDVYAMKPDQLQLGFLKVLKGTPIEKCVIEYGIAYQDKTPNEVLYTNWLSYDEIIKLKAVEEMVEVYYNSAQFRNAMIYLAHFFTDAFDMYERLAEYYERNNLLDVSHARVRKYQILLEFFTAITVDKADQEQEIQVFLELLEYDMYLREKMKSRPMFFIDKSQYGKEARAIAEFGSANGIKKAEQKKHQTFHVQYFYIDPIRTAETGMYCAGGKYLIFDYGRRNALNHDAYVTSK